MQQYCRKRNRLKRIRWTNFTGIVFFCIFCLYHCFAREEWRNQNIPYEKFGYESLDQFLRSLTDIIDWWQPKLGTYTYKAKVTQATAHVHLMIAAQRKHPKPSKRQPHRSSNSNGDRYASGFSMSLNGRMPPSLSTNRPRLSVPPRFRKQFGSVEREPIMPASTFDSTKNSSSFNHDFSRSFNNCVCLNNLFFCSVYSATFLDKCTS